MPQPSWDKTLFINHPELYLPVLLEARKTAEIEVKSLHSNIQDFGSKKKARILDLFCGIGRHSAYLSKFGYDVVGYDPCKLYLDEAMKWSQPLASSGSNLKYYVGEPDNVSQILNKAGEGNSMS